MLYIPKISDYLEILTDGERKDFVAINFIEYFKPTEETLHSKLKQKNKILEKLLNRFISL